VTPDYFLPYIEVELLKRGEPFDWAALAKWVRRMWPLIEDMPDAYHWAWRFLRHRRGCVEDWFWDLTPQERRVLGRLGGKARHLRRGLQCVPDEKQRRIASLGGKMAHQLGRAHEFTAEEARAAGRKGARMAMAAGPSLHHGRRRVALRRGPSRAGRGRNKVEWVPGPDHLDETRPPAEYSQAE
jgi:hypothetical protein